MTSSTRPSAYQRLLRSVIATLILKRIGKRERALDLLSRRMGLLQMGASAELFESVAGLSDIATGGLGSKRALQTIRGVAESGAALNLDRIEDALGEIDIFLKDAKLVLDDYDRGRARRDRLFVIRKNVRGLF